MKRPSKSQLRTIQNRIESTIKANSRKEWARNAAEFRDLYSGKWFGTNEFAAFGENRVNVNMAQVNVDIMVAAIAYADPEFQIVPLDQEAEVNSHYQKAALRKVWSEINAIRPERRRLKDSLIYGYGVNFVGWRFEESDSPAQEGGKRPEYLPQNGPLPTLLTGGGDIVIPPDEAEEETSEDSIVVYDDPIVRRVNPLRFYIDPDHDDLDDLRDAKFVVEEKIVPLDYVKNDERYSYRNEVRGSERLAFDDDDKDKSSRNKEFESTEKRVKLYEYWQKDGRLHVVFAEGMWDKPLMTETWPYRYASYPYTTLVYRDLPEDQLPQGVIQSAAGSVKMYSKYRTMQINHDEAMSRCPIGYDASGLTNDGKKAMQGNDVNPMVECNGVPANIIHPIPMPALPSDFYATQAAVKDDINGIMSVNDYMRGDAGSTRRTLGEVNMTVSLSAARGQLVQRDYERACEKDAMLILALLQDNRYCDRKRWMSISGEQDEQTPGYEWNYSNVLGQSSIRVVCNSTRVQTPESMQNSMAFGLQSLAAYVQNGMINPAPFIRKFGQSINLTPKELQEAIAPMNGQGQQMQMVQQLGQQVQQMGQMMQQIGQAVQQIQQRLDAGAMDAKTQMEMQKAQMEMQMAAEKHQLEMSIIAEKAQISSQGAIEHHQIRVADAATKLKNTEDKYQIERAIKIDQASGSSEETGDEPGEGDYEGDYGEDYDL